MAASSRVQERRAQVHRRRLAAQACHLRAADADCQDTSAATDHDPLEVKVVRGLREIASRFDAFILDQWGVLHDGDSALPAAPKCLSALGQAGKKLLILSNDGNRKASGKSGVAKLERMGFDTQWIPDSVLAGEEAIRWMISEYGHRRIKVSWFAWGPAGFDASYLSGLDCDLVPLEQAELVVAQGTARLLTAPAHLADDACRTKLDYPTTGELHPDVKAGLYAAATNKAILVCCNPDLKVVKPAKRGGGFEYCPGGIAQFFERAALKAHEIKLTNCVKWFGKPHRPVFEACCAELAKLGVTDRSRIAMVGDALETDVVGASAAGLKTVLVAGTGIHAQALVPQEDAILSSDNVAALAREHGVPVPDFTVRAFAW